MLQGPLVLFGALLFALPLSAGSVIAKGVYAPLMVGTTVSADLRVERVEKGAKKVGFYRVAIIPAVVFENVAISFRRLEEAAEVVSLIHSLMGEMARGQSIELVDVSLSLKEHDGMLIRAGTATADRSGGIILRDVILEAGAQRHIRGKASLSDCIAFLRAGTQRIEQQGK